MIRRPAVAGYFYEGTSEALLRQVEGFILRDAKKVRALGILSPHAGLMYSGSAAGAVYSSVVLPDTFVLIGPNHTGLGAPVSIVSSGRWEMPLGSVEIDERLASEILKNSRRIQEDTLAHIREHSLEVQLPFIQYFKKEFKIVPIQMLDTRLETCLDLGRAVSAAISELRTPNSGLSPLIVASSDMTHYEPAKTAQEKDHKAIEQILKLDPEGLYRAVKSAGITMCGCGPAVAMLVACKDLGATKAELIKYTNSGEASGDYNQVVGYAGIVVC